MTIKAGDKLPDVTLTRMSANGPQPVKTGDYFKGRKVLLFGVRGRGPDPDLPQDFISPAF